MSAPAAPAPGAAKRTVLSDRFLIGEELGRGAYGQVFKGMDAHTGDVVAIKQISLSGVSQENLASVMGEIDLLKTLNHKNIVKYIGSFKTRSHLYIILEFMENGSLSSVIKPNRFGVFPESLVAVYIAQVLQGLAYLHDQGVVHRDIKGANILTTKEGLVKLADFGVAAKLGELENGRDELQQNVVGTPYWMAPEVIEMTQVTSASDIWSVGCLILELLTGYPPYFDLQPMSALFRIVQDDHPPLPEGMSPLLDDFLLLCFQKDPAGRPDARTLLQHEWIQYNRRTLRSSWTRAQGYRTRGRQGAADAHESVANVVERMLVSAEAGGEEDAVVAAAAAAAAAAAGGGGTGPAAGGDLFTRDAAVGPLETQTPLTLALQQDMGGGFLLPMPPTAAAGSPRQRDGDGAAARRQTGAAASASGRPPLAVPPGGAAGGLRGAQQQQPQQQQEQQQAQQQPAYNGPGPPPAGAAAAAAVPAVPGVGPLSISPRERGAAGDWDGALGTFLARLHGGDSGAPTPTARLAHHGSNLSAWLDEGLDKPGAAGGRRGAASNGTVGWYGDAAAASGSYDSAPSPVAGARAATGAGGGQAVGGGGDMYGRTVSSTSLAESVSASSATAMEGGPDGSLALETKRKVRDLVRSLRPGARDANMTPAQACASLSLLFARHPESKQYFLSEGGVLAAMEMLDADTTKVLEPAVDLVCAFVAGDTRLLESLCLVGVVPAMCRMALPAPPGAERLRARAAGFVQQLCFSGVTTLQMLIACGGLRHLVLMVQDNLQDTASLTPTGIACIWRALEAPSALPINYVCRLLSQAGLVPRLLAVTRQAITLQARSDRAQLLGASTGAGSAGSASRHGGSKAWGDDDGAPRSPLSSREFGAAAAAAAAGGSASADDLQRQAAARSAGDASGSPSRRGGGPGDSAAPAGADASTNAAAGAASANGSVPPAAAAAAGSQRSVPAAAALEVWQLSAAPGQGRVEWALDKCTSLLLVLAHGDAVVKAAMCSKDGLQSLLDCLQRLQPPHLVKVMRALRWLTSEASVLPAIKDAGAIGQLVPLLSREREAAVGPDAQLEALHALYNICKFNKRVHLEVAATAGAVAHLCRFAVESSPLLPPRSGDGAAAAAAAAAVDPLTAAAAARRAAVRGFVVPMLIGMASTSSSTRAKLWACNGIDIFLQLLGEEEPQIQVGLLRALDTWLAEDHARVEHRLVAREAVAQLVALLAAACRARDMATLPQVLDSLKLMLGRSSKLAVALATGGLVPPLLEPLAPPPGPPILRARLLEILRALYEHHPRPKEFIMKFRVADALRALLESSGDGRGEEPVKAEAQKLLNAFHINVLL